MSPQVHPDGLNASCSIKTGIILFISLIPIQTWSLKTTPTFRWDTSCMLAYLKWKIVAYHPLSPFHSNKTYMLTYCYVLLKKRSPVSARRQNYPYPTRLKSVNHFGWWHKYKLYNYMTEYYLPQFSCRYYSSVPF